MTMILNKRLTLYTLTLSLLATTAYSQDYTLTETLTSADQINAHFLTNQAGDNKHLILGSGLSASNHFNPLMNGQISLDGSEQHFSIDGDGKMGFQVLNNGKLALHNLALTGFSFNPSGAAVSNTTGTLDDLVNVDFIGNGAESSSDVKGGALYNAASMGNLSGRFLNNKAVSNNASASGGAFYYDAGSSQTPSIGTITADFTGNRADAAKSANGGAVYINAAGANISGTFEDNAAISSGGAAAGGAIANLQAATLRNSTFKNNFAKSSASGYTPRGGAVFAGNDLTIIADGSASSFSDNYTLNADGDKTYNAVYLTRDHLLSLQTANAGSITFNDGIDGNSANKYTIEISGDGTGEVSFNDAVQNAKHIKVSDTVLNLGHFTHADGTLSEASLDGANLTLSNSTLNLENDSLQTINLNTFSSSADVKLRADANLGTGESDRINAANIAGGSQITLEKLNILADGNADITLFGNQKAPQIVNLDSFAAFSAANKYTFSTSGDGVLQVASSQNRGLNSVIADDTLTKSYTVGDSGNISGDLGALAGGPGATLSILGNDKVLDGNGFAGLEIADQQKLNIDDTLVSNFASALGGAVSSSGTVTVTNSSFTGNRGGKAGAVYSTGDVTVNADGKISRFSGNTLTTDLSNAVFMDDSSATLKLNAVNSGQIVFDDRIDGADGYTVEVYGDKNSSVLFNNYVDHAGAVKIYGSDTRLAEENLLDGTNIALNGGTLNLSNGRFGTATFADFSNAGGNLKLDADPANALSDKLVITGDLIGKTNIIVNAVSDDKPQNDILFAETHNDNPDTEGSFEILRVNGSPYQWETKYDTLGKDWYMNTKAALPGGDMLVVPEVVAYLGLNNAAFEQTRGVFDSIRRKANSQTVYTGCCGLYDRNYNGEPLYNLWAAPVYTSAKVDSPVEFDQDLYGLEAGGDLLINAHNRFGVFGSYRRGKYDFSGKADHLYAEKPGKIDIDSYLLGLYYDYARGSFRGMAALFGGIQKADLRTGDYINSKTDGTEFGAHAEAGYAYHLTDKLIAEPSLGVTRTTVKFGNIRDAAGKISEFNTARHLEIEAAFKLEQKTELADGEARFYLRPGMIRAFHRDDAVRISGLGKLNSMKNDVYARLEGGVSAAVQDNLDIFCNIAYTFNDDYRQTSFNAGLNLNF